MTASNNCKDIHGVFVFRKLPAEFLSLVNACDPPAESTKKGLDDDINDYIIREKGSPLISDVSSDEE